MLVLDTGSISAAARVLQVTPHAVSQRIMRLERQAGTRLLHRTTRRLSATAEGLALHVRAVRVLDELAAADAELEAGQHELAGVVRIAMPPVLATRDLLLRLDTLTARHAQLHLQVSVTNAVVDLTAGAYGAAVCVGAVPDSALTMHHLGDVAWPLCASPAYLESHGRPETIDALAAHRCLRLLTARPQEVWPLLSSVGTRTDVPVTGRFECDDSRVLGDATYAGLGIGVRPPGELRRAVAAGTLMPVLPGWRLAGGGVSVLMPAGRGRVPRMAALLNVLREAVQEVL